MEFPESFFLNESTSYSIESNKKKFDLPFHCEKVQIICYNEKQDRYINQNKH